MRRLVLPAAAAAAFLLGARLAGGAVNDGELVAELARHQEMLLQDLTKIEKARADVVEIRKMRESGQFVLNEEERRMERRGREDFHIFMERFRNDTLEVLEMLDHAVDHEDFVDPLRRIYGRALDEIVRVKWQEEDLEGIASELEEGYGVKIHVSGEMEQRKTVSLEGEMSLLSVLLQLENQYDGRFVVKEGRLWFLRLGDAGEPKGE